MAHGIKKALETVAGFLTPPACREEVLGDLHERNASWTRFCVDALRTIPLVIFSRIRRTANPQVLLMLVVVIYLSFYGAAWYRSRGLLYQSWGLARLALPALVTLLILLLEDAYAKSRDRSPFDLVRGPLLGLAGTFLSQAGLWAVRSEFTLPLDVVLYGGTLGLLLTSALRLLFSPRSTSRQGPI